MKERMIFVCSGNIKNPDDIQEIEFWGHDAGEFIPLDLYEYMMELEEEESQKQNPTKNPSPKD